MPGQTCFSYLLACSLKLVAGQGNSDGLRSLLLRSANHQGTPPATDVQQPLPRCQHEFGQNVIQFGVLGLGQGLGTVGEVPAGVDQGLTQPQPVKVVGDIVMVLNGPVIAGPVMLTELQQPPKSATPRQAVVRQLGYNFHNILRPPFNVKTPTDAAVT